MQLTIEHRTTYSFSRPQSRLIQLLRMTPSSNAGQQVVDWRINVDRDARLRYRRDGYGNETAMLYVDGPVEEITLTVEGDILTEDVAGVVSGTHEPLAPLVFLRPTALTAGNAEIDDFARDEAGRGEPLQQAHALNAAIHRHIRFNTEATSVDQPAAAAFASGHGVCQDMAHLFIAAARAIHLPARYVSGHLFRRDGATEQLAAHAWVEGASPRHRLGRLRSDARHLPGRRLCAASRSPSTIAAPAPVSGARTGGGTETPRRRRPCRPLAEPVAGIDLPDLPLTRLC
jgi:transglutaminase-like putative cysteine protease